MQRRHVIYIGLCATLALIVITGVRDSRPGNVLSAVRDGARPPPGQAQPEVGATPAPAAGAAP